MNILGLNITGPNTSAALITSLGIQAFVEEERFTRVKLATDVLPTRSINYCLKESKIKFEDLDQIAIGWDYRKYPDYMKGFFESQYRDYEKSQLDIGSLSINLTTKSLDFIVKKLEIAFAKQGWSLDQAKLSFFNHHQSHAASVAFLNDKKRQLVFVMDGSGEELATSIWLKDGQRLSMLEKWEVPNSLGYFYGALTEFLGFSVFTGEGKVMGMAPYGTRNDFYREKLRQFLIPLENGSYEVDPTKVYFGRHTWSYRFTDSLCNLLERKPRIAETEITKEDYDLAFETQSLLEEVVKSLVKSAIHKYQIPDVALSGGVAMNCKMNGVVSRMIEVSSCSVTPASNDAGVALGAAFLSSLDFKGNIDSFIGVFNPYLGPSFSDDSIREIFHDAKISNYVYFPSDEDLVKDAARELEQGKIIGWFQGRMEVGARALGNRSILAHPGFPDMKDKINSQVKRREKFRPFAPVVLKQEALEWLECEVSELDDHKFMLKALQVRGDKKSKISSVVHVDNSVRPQILDAVDNPLYHKLLTEFFKISGIPMLLNTSLNVRGEPIICTPDEALRCFFSHGLDALYLGHFVLKKK